MNILFLVIGTFVIVMGIVVWRFKILEIIIGINEDNIANRNAYARYIGINYILMGLAINGVALLTFINNKISDLTIIVGFTFILYLFASIIIFGGKKYKKQ